MTGMVVCSLPAPMDMAPGRALAAAAHSLAGSALAGRFAGAHRHTKFGFHW